MLELGEHLFDRVQIWRIRRQVEQLCLGSADCFADRGALVAGKVVHHDNVAGCQRRDEKLFDPFGEACPVDRLIKHARRIDPVTAQGGDEGHGAPMTVWHFGVQSVALWRPSAQRRHVRLRPGFINENKPSWINSALIFLPLFAPSRDLRPKLLCGQHAFF